MSDEKIVVVQTPIGKALGRYLENIEALRTFVSTTGQFLEEGHRQTLDKYQHDLLPVRLAERELGLGERDVERDQTLDEASDVKVTVTDTEDGSKEVKLSLTENRLASLRRALRHLKLSSKQQTLLYGNSLIALVSASEWFIAELLHAHFNEYPESAAIQERQLTYSDLVSAGSINDAKNLLLNSKIEEVLRGSFKDWMKYFEKQLKLKLKHIYSQADQLVEIHQRRNVLVHNGGIANNIYMSSISSALRKGVDEGDELVVTREYVDRSITCFEVAFVTLAAELWGKTSDDSKEKGGAYNEIVYDHLVAERWDAAISLGSVLSEGEGLTEETRLLIRVNYWQAVKWSGGFDQVRAEIQSFDVSAKSIEFKMAKHVLLDEYEDAMQYIPELLESGRVKQSGLREWPLFRDLRAQQIFISKYPLSEEETS